MEIEWPSRTNKVERYKRYI